MYAGRIVEIGSPEDLMAAPVHPYTRALIDAVPKGLDGRVQRRKPLAGAPPAPGEAVTGCPFRTRCPDAMAICASRMPDTVRLSTDHDVVCHLATKGNCT
jgi:oligopeptide/dipeptide ABC transporter ATP-binding protein